MGFPDDDQDWAYALLWFVWYFFSLDGFFSSSSSGLNTRAIYRMYSKYIRGSPPSWVFGVVWPILYSLLAIGTWLGFRSTDFRVNNKQEYDLFVLFAALHAVFLKLWIPIFFGQQSFSLALFDIFLAMGTNIAVIVLTARQELWVTVAFFAVELAWLLFALYLNAMWLKFQTFVSKRTAAMRCCQAQLYKQCLEGPVKGQ